MAHYIVTAKNLVTNHIEVLGRLEDAEEVIENCENIQYDEDENPADWAIYVNGEPYDEFYDEYLSFCEDGVYDLECGFDPYEGCYTFDC